MSDRVPDAESKSADTVHRRTWWKEAALLSAAATLLGTLAVTSHAFFQSSLEEEKNLQEIRTTYLDRAIDPARNTMYRKSVLSFLVKAYGTEDPLGVWASEELAR